MIVCFICWYTIAEVLRSVKRSSPSIIERRSSVPSSGSERLLKSCGVLSKARMSSSNCACLKSSLVIFLSSSKVATIWLGLFGFTCRSFVRAEPPMKPTIITTTTTAMIFELFLRNHLTRFIFLLRKRRLAQVLKPYSIFKSGFFASKIVLGLKRSQFGCNHVKNRQKGNCGLNFGLILLIMCGYEGTKLSKISSGIFSGL